MRYVFTFSESVRLHFDVKKIDALLARGAHCGAHTAPDTNKIIIATYHRK